MNVMDVTFSVWRNSTPCVYFISTSMSNTNLSDCPSVCPMATKWDGLLSASTSVIVGWHHKIECITFRAALITSTVRDHSSHTSRSNEDFLVCLSHSTQWGTDVYHFGVNFPSEPLPLSCPDKTIELFHVPPGFATFSFAMLENTWNTSWNILHYTFIFLINKIK